jgi:probable addiction module antidote protein
MIRIQAGNFGDAKYLGDGLSALRPGAGIPGLLSPTRRHRGDFALRRRQENTSGRHRKSQSHDPRTGVTPMTIKTIPYDPADDLTDEQDQVELLAEAFASGDQKFIAAALGAVARARGMSMIAEKAGVTRPALYKALSEAGDPQLSTLLGVVHALGLRLAVEPLAHSAE